MIKSIFDKLICFFLVLMLIIPLNFVQLKQAHADDDNYRYIPVKIDMHSFACADFHQTVQTTEFHAELDEMLSLYLLQYRTGNPLYPMYATKIVHHIFEPTHNQYYGDALLTVDCRINNANEGAIYDLAKKLQLHWENSFGFGLMRKRAARISEGAKIGKILGLILAGATLWKKPQNAKDYFILARNLLGGYIGGGVAGALSGEYLHESGFLDKNIYIPAAPAQVMRLGVSTDDYYYNLDEAAIWRKLYGQAAGLGATITTIYLMRTAKVARYLNLATTPAKVHPLVLVGSILVGLIVEYGVERAVWERQFSNLKQKAFHARDQLIAANNNDDIAKVFHWSDALVQASHNLAIFLNQKILEKVQDTLVNFNNKVESAEKRYGSNSSTFISQLNYHTRELSRKLKRIKPYQGDYNSYVVRELLTNNQSEAIDQLGRDYTMIKNTYVEGFDRWITAIENREQICFDDQTRNRSFKDLLAKIDEYQTDFLVQIFREDGIRRRPYDILLRSAALLRWTNNDHIKYQSDFLMSLIGRNSLLFAATMANQNLPSSPLDNNGATGY